MAANDFGTVFFDNMTLTEYKNDAWSPTQTLPSDKLPLHPAAHVLHYGSSCFEGMKAFKTTTGKIAVFRIDDGIKRMQNSAKGMYLPVPDAAQLKEMILSLLDKHRDEVPSFPRAAYIRPALIGTEAAVGKATAPSTNAILFVIISPVGDYMSPNDKTRVLLNTEDCRCAPHFGYIKAGGNYASALPLVRAAAEKYQTQQIIFAPKNDVQETGATNCLLINDKTIMTKPLSKEFLPGITRDSILKVGKSLGYEVIEAPISAEFLMNWIKDGEIALSGTAAVMVPVNEVVYEDKIYSVNGGKPSANITKLRKALTDIQQGAVPDPFGWVTLI